MVKYSDVDSIYASLSDPIRREILLRIASDTLNLKQLAREKRVSQPAISKHVKVLEKANLIERKKVSRTYRFTLKEAAAYWVEQFKNLEKFLKKGEK